MELMLYYFYACGCLVVYAVGVARGHGVGGSIGWLILSVIITPLLGYALVMGIPAVKRPPDSAP